MAGSVIPGASLLTSPAALAQSRAWTTPGQTASLSADTGDRALSSHRPLTINAWSRDPKSQVAHPRYARYNLEDTRSALVDLQARRRAFEPPPRVTLPPETSKLSEGPFIIRDDYSSLFTALRSDEEAVIVGDLGTFTVDSRSSIDLCLCLGMSVSVSLGVKMGRPHRTVSSVIGDGGLLHTGRAGLDEVECSGLDLLVAVIENGGSQSTGGHSIPGDLNRLYLGREVESIDLSAPLSEYERIIESLRARDGLKILRVLCSPELKEER